MKCNNPTWYIFIISSFLLLTNSSFASDSVRISRSQYISSYKDDALRDMNKTGVPASITLAQALLESDDGNSDLAREANNHFGVKCAEWTGATFIKDDDHKNECFRKYKSALESYDDHSVFLHSRPRYASLFELPVSDYKGWANGLKSAGYATNPHYADQLIKIIEDNNLYELDCGNKLPALPPPVATNKTKTEKSRKVFFSPVSNVISAIGRRHEVFTNNGVPYVIAKAKEDYKDIADEFDMNVWQIFKYNELDQHGSVKEGQRIYLKPKKRQGKDAFTMAASGQTLHDIAQDQGIKLRLLLKWNHLPEDAEASAGQKIYLNKH